MNMQYEQQGNMNELKQRKTENRIDYVLVGDYYIPDLKEQENRLTRLDYFLQRQPKVSTKAYVIRCSS